MLYTAVVATCLHAGIHAKNPSSNKKHVYQYYHIVADLIQASHPTCMKTY